MKRFAAILTVTLLGFAAPASAAFVQLVQVNGSINPVTAGHIARGIEVASAAGAECLIVQLDTPGGLLDSTKTIVHAFYESRVPVVVWVAPPGANATSAGCFITLASDIAAMAPNTTIGAAHPVTIGGGGAAPDDTMQQKIENFAVSYIESIAVRRGRNAEWAKAAVRDSESITAEKALEIDVIEIIAATPPELLRQLDGWKVRGKALQTAGAEVRELKMTFRDRAFQMFWRPEVLMILMLVAVYGIIGELSNPGMILPGVVGVIALVLALYMFAVLPVNVAGVLLIVLAVALFIAEAFTPTTGLLSAGGVLALFFGFFFLFDRADPVFRLSLKLIIPATIATAAFFLFIVAAGLRAQSRTSRVGPETMIGRNTAAVTAIDSHRGKVFVEGEYWNAVSQTPIEKGAEVEIIEMKGLTLRVRPMPAAPPSGPPTPTNPSNEEKL